LTAWNFSFQNCSSPFLALANTAITYKGRWVLIYK
jgi:hypothetical protein